eukprot:scaffold1049_cov152-Skeletonema_menzelii.AAC.1
MACTSAGKLHGANTYITQRTTYAPIIYGHLTEPIMALIEQAMPSHGDQSTGAPSNEMIVEVSYFGKRGKRRRYCLVDCVQFNSCGNLSCSCWWNLPLNI